MTMRHGADQTLTFGSPAADARHVRRRAGLVEEDEPIRIEQWLQCHPSLAGLYDVLALLLLSLEMFFERQAKPGYDPPHHGIADADLLRLRQPGPQFVQCSVGRCRDLHAQGVRERRQTQRRMVVLGPGAASPRSRNRARARVKAMWMSSRRSSRTVSRRRRAIQA